MNTRRRIPRSLGMRLLVTALAITFASVFGFGTRSNATTSAVIALDTNVVMPGVQPSVTYPANSPEIPVDVAVANADHVGAFEFQVAWDPLALQLLRWNDGPFLESTGRTSACHTVINDGSAQIGCSTFGPVPPPGPSGDGVLARLVFRPRTTGPTCAVLLMVETATVLGDPLPTDKAGGCVTLSPDSDGDGCSDSQELGADVLLGGERDPLDPWDFFDVPVPALGSGSAAAGTDHSVSLADVYAVVFYVGTTDGGPPNALGAVYGSDLNRDGERDGRDYDRRPSGTLRQPWRSGSPNGAVTLQDALVALAQVGASCRPVPAS